MAQTPEVKIKNRVKEKIEEICTRRGLHWRIDWNAGSGFMSTLDAVGVIAGHPFVAEIKRFDVEAPLTGRQRVHVTDFRNAGAFVHVIDDETSLVYLCEWLETLEPREPHWP